MIKLFAIAVVAFLGGVLLFAASRPDSFRIERSATIKAPPEKLYAQVNDLKAWTAWSPWERIDPALKRTYSGPQSGKGAAYAWEGNKDVGVGRMEITDAVSASTITIKLDFLKPFEAHNTAEFTMLPQGNATSVHWVMHGPSNFMSKVMHVFMNIEKMVGKDFEAGLANLKRLTEK